jgi:hypothetical protein
MFVQNKITTIKFSKTVEIEITQWSLGVFEIRKKVYNNAVPKIA